MRRDLELQQGFNQKLLAENKDLKEDVNSLKRAHAAQEHDAGLLAKQVRGLEEDNERLASMFAQFKSEPVSAPIEAKGQQFEAAKREDNKAQAAKKGW